MLTKTVGVVAVFLVAMSLAGCAGEGLHPARAALHKQMLSDIHAKSVEIGLDPGTISKSCVVWDCNQSDNYESSAYITDPSLTDNVVCDRFVELATALNYTSSRRDRHWEEDAVGAKLPDLKQSCVETIGVNEGTGTASQSEGLVITGFVESTDRPIGFAIQLQSVNVPDGAPAGERGYFLGMFTTDEVIYSVGD